MGVVVWRFPWRALFPELQLLVRERMSPARRLLLALTSWNEYRFVRRSERTWRSIVREGLGLHLAPARRREWLEGCRWRLLCPVLQQAIREHRTTIARILVRDGKHGDQCEDCLEVVVAENAWWIVPELWQLHRWGHYGGCLDWHVSDCSIDRNMCTRTKLTEQSIDTGNLRFAHWLQEHGHWREH